LSQETGGEPGRKYIMFGFGGKYENYGRSQTIFGSVPGFPSSPVKLFFKINEIIFGGIKNTLYICKRNKGRKK